MKHNPEDLLAFKEAHLKLLPEAGLVGAFIGGTEEDAEIRSFLDANSMEDWIRVEVPKFAPGDEKKAARWLIAYGVAPGNGFLIAPAYGESPIEVAYVHPAETSSRISLGIALISLMAYAEDTGMISPCKYLGQAFGQVKIPEGYEDAEPSRTLFMLTWEKLMASEPPPISVRAEGDEGWRGPLERSDVLDDAGWRDPTQRELFGPQFWQVYVLDEPEGSPRQWYDVGIHLGAVSDIAVDLSSVYTTAEGIRFEETFPPSVEEIEAAGLAEHVTAVPLQSHGAPKGTVH